MRFVSRSDLSATLWLLALLLPSAAHGAYKAAWGLTACGVGNSNLTSPVSGTGSTNGPVDLNISGGCENGFRATADATYSVDATQGSLQSTATSTLGASATVLVSLGFSANLVPPAGGGGVGSSVMVGAASSYTFDLAGYDPSVQGGDFARFNVFIVKPKVFSILASGQPAVQQNVNGSFSGLVQTMNISYVCCTLYFFVDEWGSVTQGANVTITDPVSLNLPPGWTYTLSPGPDPDPLFAVPEPPLSIPLGAGILLTLALVARRRLNAGRASAGNHWAA